MTVSATAAAFEGFRVTRQHPVAVMVWAVVWLVGLIVMMAASLPFVAPYMGEIIATGGDPDALSVAAASSIQRAGLTFIPVALVLQGLLSPAVYRAVLCPDEKRNAFLRLGADEGRVLVVALVAGGVSFALNLGGMWLESWAMQTMGLVAQLFVSLVVFIVLVIVGVRLSLIAPMTFMKRRLAFREGWSASGKLFWPLLGISVLALAMAAVVGMLLLVIALPLQAASAGQAASPGSAIVALLMLALMPFGAALVATILWAPFAAMCRELSED